MPARTEQASKGQCDFLISYYAIHKVFADHIIVVSSNNMYVVFSPKQTCKVL